MPISTQKPLEKPERFTIDRGRWIRDELGAKIDGRQCHCAMGWYFRAAGVHPDDMNTVIAPVALLDKLSKAGLAEMNTLLPPYQEASWSNNVTGVNDKATEPTQREAELRTLFASIGVDLQFEGMHR